jgi:hypothetical protein
MMSLSDAGPHPQGWGLVQLTVNFPIPVDGKPRANQCDQLGYSD